jgi:NAD dependent epimerase/dehydratase family enzyme
MSWIGLDDVVGAFHHVLQQETVSGPINVTAPEPVSNAEFSATLGRVLSRPAILPAPAFAVRLLMGREMAEETALAGIRALPARLLTSGYRYRHEALEDALRHCLGRPH